MGSVSGPGTSDIVNCFTSERFASDLTPVIPSFVEGQPLNNNDRGGPDKLGMTRTQTIVMWLNEFRRLTNIRNRKIERLLRSRPRFQRPPFRKRA